MSEQAWVTDDGDTPSSVFTIPDHSEHENRGYSGSDRILIFDFWCFNATFNNISAISWRPVLVVEEAGVPRENHRPWASNW